MAHGKDYRQETFRYQVTIITMEQLHLTAIRRRADLYDATGEWPAEDLDALALAGAMKWAAPAEFGGAVKTPRLR